jgi:glycogen operon protein
VVGRVDASTACGDLARPRGTGLSAGPGWPFPLGATPDAEGTNFALFSEHAERVELCLFAPDGTEIRHELTGRSGSDWHVYLPGVGPGERYGYRVHGPYAPGEGNRFNPAKLLIDPHARAIEKGIDWDGARVFAYPPDEEDGDAPDEVDDAAAIPKCIVVDPGFDWEGDRRLETPWEETTIYEVHVKGFTRRHPGVRDDLRGTYAGLASDAAVGYLTELGVSAVELLPIHHSISEEFLHGRGLTNYWGYSSIGFFAPHAAYAATGDQGEQVNEFKGMVKALHRAGIEVILDVVYNHTAESDHRGPTLAFRGIDNASYYRLDGDRRRYVDFTGTGNTLDTTHPSVLRMVMDSLRYWVTDCHVDGFRFDLASTLARDPHDFNRRSSFLAAIHQDPVLSQVKLIAEPWDLGSGGYQVGGFPPCWSEWNDAYRDTMRDFWRAQTNAAAFAGRFTGSRDLFREAGRAPWASTNFITAHDGFTLRDLVSYNGKHNEANLEDNHDGRDDNRSWNCGAEGPTDAPEVNALRELQQRNFLATLLLSHGTPMLLAGDERGRSQGGNNNAWCQDNETSWLDWEHGDEQLLAFTRKLLELRRRHSVFRGERFLNEGAPESSLPDAWWFRTDGRAMAQRDWQTPETHELGVYLNSDEGDSVVFLLNPTPEAVTFRLPPRRFGFEWTLELATAMPDAADEVYRGRAAVEVAARSLMLLRRVR